MYLQLTTSSSADDGEDDGFFYDEDAAMENADTAGDRAEMLDHLDSLLQMPRADELDNVSLLFEPKALLIEWSCFSR